MMDINFLITKYENQIKELIEYKKKLANEYSKTTLLTTKEIYNQVIIRINTLEQIINDLKNIK